MGTIDIAYHSLVCWPICCSNFVREKNARRSVEVEFAICSAQSYIVVARMLGMI